MLGNHDGMTPLGAPQDAAAPMLRAMGRLKVGGDVPQRRKLIARVVAQLDAADQHWMETLASGLSADGGLEAIPAHLVALASAWELREGELATMIRDVNAAASDPFTGRAVHGIIAAKPEVGERMTKGRINSDEVMLRVALAHIFRRDPGSTFQMFMIDGVVQQLNKVMKLGVSEFVKSCLERFDDSPAPEGAWGYVMVLRDISARSGYFIYPPTDAGRAHLQDLRGKLEAMMGPLSQDAFHGHISAAAFSGYLLPGDLNGFAGLMSALLDDMGERFVVLYAREEEDGQGGGGTHTSLLPIKAKTADEARRMAVKMPEITMHDDMKVLSEFLAQKQDMQNVRKD